MCREITQSALFGSLAVDLRKGVATAGRPAASLPKAKDSAKASQSLEKTRLCKFFLSGRCRRGQACTFAHGQASLKGQPDLFRTQFCFQYLRSGICSYGEGCSFAHSSDELRSVARKADDHATSIDGPSDFEASFASLQSEVELRRSQLDAFEGEKDTKSDCFGVVAGADQSAGSCLTAASLMPAPTFIPVAAFMQVVDEQLQPMMAIGANPFLHCAWSGMPDACFSTTWSRQTSEGQSSPASGSSGVYVEDEGWTSACSGSMSNMDGDTDAETEAEVEAAVVVKNTFISLEPVSDLATAIVPSHARAASAPPLRRRV